MKKEKVNIGEFNNEELYFDINYDYYINKRFINEYLVYFDLKNSNLKFQINFDLKKAKKYSEKYNAFKNKGLIVLINKKEYENSKFLVSGAITIKEYFDMKFGLWKKGLFSRSDRNFFRSLLFVYENMFHKRTFEFSGEELEIWKNPERYFSKWNMNDNTFSAYLVNGKKFRVSDSHFFELMNKTSPMTKIIELVGIKKPYSRREIRDKKLLSKKAIKSKTIKTSEIWL